MRGVYLAMCLAIALFGTPSRAAGNPFGLDSLALASPVDAPIDVAVDFENMDVDGAHTSASATCAHEIGHDSAPAASLNPIAVPTPTPGPLDSSEPSETPSESDSLMPGEGASLVSGLLNCAGATTASVAGRIESWSATPAVTPERSRLQAAIQAGAITASLVLVTWLGFLVAAMTRRSSHAHAGRRRY